MKPNFKLTSGVLALLISFTTSQVINADSNSVKTEVKNVSTANKIKKKSDTTSTGYAGWFTSTRIAKFLKLEKFAREYPRVFTFVSFTVITAAVTAVIYGSVRLFENPQNICEMTQQEIDNEIEKLEALKKRTQLQKQRLEDLISTRDTYRDINYRLSEEIPSFFDSILKQISKLEGLKNKPNINQQTQEKIQKRLDELCCAKDEKLKQKEEKSDRSSLLQLPTSYGKEFDLAYVKYLLGNNSFQNQQLEPHERDSLLALKAILEYRIAFSDEKVSTDEKKKLLASRNKAIEKAVLSCGKVTTTGNQQICRKAFERLYMNNGLDLYPPFDQLAAYCKLVDMSPTEFFLKKERAEKAAIEANLTVPDKNNC